MEGGSVNYILDELCGWLRNWFATGDSRTDTYTVADGIITLPFLANGQYYRVIGSTFNDGVHKYGDPGDILVTETFTGTIQAMAVPSAVIAIAEEIGEWNDKNAAAIASPYQSESFGGYSYSKGTTGVTWRNVFGARLARWRKL